MPSCPLTRRRPTHFLGSVSKKQEALQTSETLGSTATARALDGTGDTFGVACTSNEMDA